MKPRGLLAVLVLSLGVLLGAQFVSTPPVEAAINPQINFQGKLTNPDGTNVSDGNYSLVFSLYNVSTGGTAIWTETQGAVAVAAGNFQVNLGSVTALPGSVDFSVASIYLGIKVGADAEMTPRVRFTAAPYAFNADKIDGFDSASLVQLSPGSQQTGNVNISGNITAGGTYNGNSFSGSQLQFSALSAASVLSAASQQLRLDSGTSGTVAVGGTNATAITLGKTGVPVAAPGGLSINAGTTVPTTDQAVIDNTGTSGVTTASVNGLNVKYKGGAAAVEASGVRIDYTPGSSSGGIWSGLRVVADPTGAGTGINGYGLKLEGPSAAGAGTDTAVRVATGWDIGVDIQSGGMQLAAQADPGVPAAGNLRFYAQDIAGRVVPKWIGPAGVDTPVQASLGFNRVAMMIPSGLATAAATTVMTSWGTTFTNVGAGAGGFTNPAPASTNLLTSVKRARLTSATAINSMASHYPSSTLAAWRGNAAGLGGFFFTTRFGLSTLQTGNRAFVGMADVTTAPTNVDPTTNTTPGKIGMAINASTGNWSFVNNVSGTVPTVTPLGANFPVNTTSLYELVLYSAPNGSSIGYRIANLSTGQETSSSVSTNIPAAATFLAPQFWMTNNAVAAAVAIDSAGWYLESDN